MKKIDYNWDEKSTHEFNLPSRKNLQLARRFFHMINGLVVVVLYYYSFSHQQMIHLLGTLACLLYVFEQIRINYPKLASKFIPITKFIMRAEEQLKESAMVPYLMAVLLTIITFPKMISIIAIATLAMADPLSAIIGIKFGKRRVVKHKSLEGSSAFFITTFFISFITLSLFTNSHTTTLFFVSALLSLFSSIFEMIPLKLDDNLTIPLFTAFAAWILCFIFNVHVY